MVHALGKMMQNCLFPWKISPVKQIRKKKSRAWVKLSFKRDGHGADDATSGSGARSLGRDQLL